MDNHHFSYNTKLRGKKPYILGGEGGGYISKDHKTFRSCLALVKVIC